MGSMSSNQPRAVYCLLAVITLNNGLARGQSCELHEHQKLIASDAAEGDQLGASVAISGNLAIVGAWGDDAAGAAYVYHRDENNTPGDPADDFWMEEVKLTPSDGTAGDLTGWSVSISGERAIVGARGHSFPTREGAAYVFRRDTVSGAAVWREEAKLAANDGNQGDDFGFSVAISGDHALIGAYKRDDACPGDPNCNSGAAYVFERMDNGTPEDPTDDTWIQTSKLTASDAAMQDRFGFSVALSDDVAIIGAFGNDHAGERSGAAYVFRRNRERTLNKPIGESWVQEAKLIASDAAAFDDFGFAVSISGDRALVGAWLDDDLGSLSGSAYVFRWDDNGTEADPTDDAWVQEDKLTAADGVAGDEFGKSVSISGDRIAVGAYEDDVACEDGRGDPDPNCDSGSAYVFRRQAGAGAGTLGGDGWLQTAKLVASDTQPADFFGRVAVADGWVVAGSLSAEAGEAAGAMYVYSIDKGCADLRSYGNLQRCFAGDGVMVGPSCTPSDLDEDGDVDLDDFERLLRALPP